MSFHDGQSLRWLPVTPESWYSHPVVIPAPRMWLRFGICFCPRECGKVGELSLQRLQKILLTDSISSQLSHINEVSCLVGRSHGKELRPAMQQLSRNWVLPTTTQALKWILSQSSLQMWPQPWMILWLQPLARFWAEDLAQECPDSWPQKLWW